MTTRLQNARYSPVNFLIVDWGFNGSAFDNCGLPEPQPCYEGETCGPAQCRPVPIQEAIDTYDWARWLPEVMVGIEDPDPEIAANYVRAAAIEFCKRARILQREIVVDLQPDINTYPLFPYPEERIVGVIGYQIEGCAVCWSNQHSSRDWVLDVARNELHWFEPTRAKQVRLLVWATPSEDACVHDVFLYDEFREDITMGARMKYVTAVHFRDRALMLTLPTLDTWDRRMVAAKNKTRRTPEGQKSQPGSGMWQTGGCCTPRRGGFR